ncbi:hypothetical protein ACFV42_48165 [Streptomyces solisilvae]|uniref:hypothetical protein n=1 Tax=Streptomyces malaysiensis TaxID=92644 RepID=UPI0036A8F926
MFLLRMPCQFTPEDYGWERQDDVTGVCQQHPHFGVWRRKRPPHFGYEALTVCAYDVATGALGAWFHPQPCPEQAPLDELWRLLRDDPRMASTSTG